ncbi:carbohydrate porin [Chlorogloeopsis fritschii PCC 9212]|uniref:Uncharacterized protein n=1 Tax=Chlorogloeopsis fritschii PCC 6912 TaxID=211165 RepID=A0A3S1A1F3_CHLFR|nr:hypothetical protein PCC6912_38420 [Chlorogloeopsis fritschii PCC 6912]
MFNHQWKLWDRLLLVLPITCSVLLLTKTLAIAQTPQTNAIATDESLLAQEFVSPEMEQVNSVSQLSSELIATSTADLVTQEDLEVSRKLQQEFVAELAMLRDRVNSLEAKAATLEANQFSTTTKLFGNVIFAVGEKSRSEPKKREGEALM